MMFRPLRLRALLGAVALATCISSAWSAQDPESAPVAASTPHDSSDSKSMQRAEVALSSADRTFISDAIKGNLKEVGYGELARLKASSSDVKGFGEQMIKDHSAVNVKLIELAMKHGLEFPSAMSRQHLTGLNVLAHKDGKSFDKAYVDDMVDDHKKDVAAFQKMSKQAGDAELRKLVNDTLPTLQSHLQHIQGLTRAGQ